MDNKTFYRMVEELRQQCRFALLGYQNIRAAVSGNDPERVFFQVHAFLGHAVFISRLLWPARASSNARGEQLRQELRVPAESALRLAGFREQIERFDEAYEDWLLGLEDRNYLDMNLMPVGTVAGFKTDTFQRSLDPELLRLALRGAGCDLAKLSEEIRLLEGATQQWLRTHHFW